MVTYNLGQQDIVIRDTSSKVNDGKYHVVRFSRTGVNSTLQVDDNQVNSLSLHHTNTTLTDRNANGFNAANFLLIFMHESEYLQNEPSALFLFVMLEIVLVW